MGFFLKSKEEKAIKGYLKQLGEIDEKLGANLFKFEENLNRENKLTLKDHHFFLKSNLISVLKSQKQIMDNFMELLEQNPKLQNNENVNHLLVSQMSYKFDNKVVTDLQNIFEENVGSEVKMMVQYFASRKAVIIKEFHERENPNGVRLNEKLQTFLKEEQIGIDENGNPVYNNIPKGFNTEIQKGQLRQVNE